MGTASLDFAVNHLERHEYFFSGRVQGVGFRYTVLQLSCGLAITGFVKNLPDGRVHVLVEGKLADIQSLLAGIERSRLSRGIVNRSVVCSPATAEFKAFKIR